MREDMKHKEHGRLKKLLYFMRPLAEDQSKWKRFREFLGSPLHVNSKLKVKMLDGIGQILDDPGPIAEEKLCQWLFPGKSYQDEKLRKNLRSKLSPLIENYLEFEALEEYQKDKARMWRYALQTANQNQWDMYFPWIYEKKAVRAVDSSPHDENYYAHQIDLAHQKDDFLSRQKQDASEVKGRYREELSALNSYHALTLLKLSCNIRNQALLAGEEGAPIIPGLVPVMDRVRKDWEDQEKIIQIYYLILCGLLRPEQEVEFFRLRAILTEEGMRYGKEEGRKMFQHVNNYCNRRYNHYKAQGNKAKTLKFQKELLDLYRYQVREGIIFHSGEKGEFIDHGDLKNLVLHFAQMGEYEFVAELIDRYSDRVLKDLREVSQVFNRAILDYFKGNFPEALRGIIRVMTELTDSTDRVYALSAKGYYLRILFELGSIEDCKRESVNMSRNIRRNKHYSRSRREKYLQFCLHLQALCKAVTEPGPAKQEGLTDLNHRIQTGPPSISVSWLQKKITELQAD